MKKKYFLLILLFTLLTSCGQLNVQNSCNCELEKNALAEAKAELAKLKRLQPPTINISSKKIPQYGLLVKAQWTEIEEKLQQDQVSQAWSAWIHGCKKLININDWKIACEAAKNLSTPTNIQVVEYLHTHFNLYKAKNEDGSQKGLVTGYYQPVLNGSRTKTKKYKIPLYTPPHDLITVDLSEVYPDLKYKRLRGRVEGNKLIPYFTREEISKKDSTEFSTHNNSLPCNG